MKYLIILLLFLIPLGADAHRRECDPYKQVCVEEPQPLPPPPPPDPEPEPEPDPPIPEEPSPPQGGGGPAGPGIPLPDAYYEEILKVNPWLNDVSDIIVDTPISDRIPDSEGTLRREQPSIEEKIRELKRQIIEIEIQIMLMDC